MKSIASHQLRGLMYARYVVDHMPVGVDNEIRKWMVTISARQPQPKLVNETVISLGQPKSDRKVWYGMGHVVCGHRPGEKFGLGRFGFSSRELLMVGCRWS